MLNNLSSVALELIEKAPHGLSNRRVTRSMRQHDVHEVCSTQLSFLSGQRNKFGSSRRKKF